MIILINDQVFGVGCCKPWSITLFNNASLGNGHAVNESLFSLPIELWPMLWKYSPLCKSYSGTISQGNVWCFSNGNCPLNMPCAEPCNNDLATFFFIRKLCDLQRHIVRAVILLRPIAAGNVQRNILHRWIGIPKVHSTDINIYEWLKL